MCKVLFKFVYNLKAGRKKKQKQIVFQQKWYEDTAKHNLKTAVLNNFASLL